MFHKSDVVVAKDGYLDKGETLQDSAGIVLDYREDNDYLVLGTLHPEKYAIAPTFSMRGCYYRLATEEEKKAWGIVDKSRLEDAERLAADIKPADVSDDLSI